MNYQDKSSNVSSIFTSIRINRRLILEMTKREIKTKYQGSLFGLTWMFINPLILLSVYTFVFSFIFQRRWGVSESESRVDVALMLFTGLIVFGIFSETMSRSPRLIISNVNYVKKVIFPLEILSLVSIGSTVFQSLINFAILLSVQLLFKGTFPATAFLLPITILPVIFFSLGVSWFLASFGVYVRDIGQVIGVITTFLLFLSAVFYPISGMPENYQILFKLNPIALTIDECRKILIYGQLPDVLAISSLTVTGIFTTFLGFWWFQKTRKGFADVL